MWGGLIFSVNSSNRPYIRVFFPLPPVTDPQFVLFKHVLSFARIMSTLCPNSCRQTARIGGAAAPPAPPSRTPMRTNTAGENIFSYPAYYIIVRPNTGVHNIWWYPDLLNTTTKYSGPKYMVVLRPTIYSIQIQR